MSRKIVVTCDVCGRQKGEANHWILYCLKSDRSYISFRGWTDSLAAYWGHLCAEECANKLLQRHLRGKPAVAQVTDRIESLPKPLTLEQLRSLEGDSWIGGKS